MKKIISSIVFVASFLAFTFSVSAQVVRTNLQETINDEIAVFTGKEGYESDVEALRSANLSNYKESDDKVNVYVFRGSTCGHCLEEIMFFANAVQEYGKYFNFYAYEAWGNKDNSNLAKNVAKELGESFTGSVPYTVIGNQTYGGFSATTGQNMLEQIKNLYNDKDRYDIKDHVDLSGMQVNKEKNNSTAVVIILLSIIAIGGIVFIYIISKSK